MSKEDLECSFCGRKKSETSLLIAGLDAHICDRCIEQAHGIVVEEALSCRQNGTVSRFNAQKTKDHKSIFG